MTNTLPSLHKLLLIRGTLTRKTRSYFPVHSNSHTIQMLTTTSSPWSLQSLSVTSGALALTMESQEQQPANRKFQYIYLIFLIPLLIFTFAINMLVTLCVYFYKPLHRPNNYYVVSLAFVDAFVGLSVMSGMVIYMAFGYWPLSEAACTVWIVLDFSCCTISMLHLCLIAEDRYYAVAKPVSYRIQGRKKTIVLIGFAWSAGFLVWIPAIVAFRTLQESSTTECFFLPHKLYVLGQASVVYVVPILTMLILYSLCVHALRKHFKRVANLMCGNHAAVTADRNQNQSYHNVTHDDSTKESETTLKSLDAKAKRRTHEHLRSVQTLGVIIGVFLFCWLPFCFFWPIQSFCDKCIPLQLYEYSYWASYLNSTINPLLYFLCNRDFRAAFKTIINKEAFKMWWGICLYKWYFW